VSSAVTGKIRGPRMGGDACLSAGCYQVFRRRRERNFVFSRLMNGKAGEEAYHSGPGVACGSGGGFI
jgi:hypothetical protein